MIGPTVGLDLEERYVMPRQMPLPGFPEGAIRLGKWVHVLDRDGTTTYFLGMDNYWSHPTADAAGRCLALASLMNNGHVRAVDVEQSDLGIAYRSLVRWKDQLARHGPGFFYAPKATRGSTVMTKQKVAECERLLEEGKGVSQAARMAGVGTSALSKALAAGRVARPDPGAGPPEPTEAPAPSKSQRSQEDARLAEGMGTACARAEERVAASIGALAGASARFERCVDVAMGGVLAGLPALCHNGLLSGLGKHLSLPKGFYSAMQVLTVLGFMALARIRRPEGLRHVPPGELGKAVGLDRVPEVRTLRKKIALLAEQGDPGGWMKQLSRDWMQEDPAMAGYLYVDGHVRVYSGEKAALPLRYVSRQKLCLRGTTDYWVNDALGRPFFVVSKTLNEGMAAALLDDVLPELLASVPSQPSQEELDRDPQMHRFVVVFDRECSTHNMFSSLWRQRVAGLSYRKNVKDLWPRDEFAEVEMPVPGGGKTAMKLAMRQTAISSGKASMPVLEVRRLGKQGHQTAIVTSALTLQSPVVAGQMFSRWCQENFFAYMMEHYDIDGLVQHGAEEIPGTFWIANPARRQLEKQINQKRRDVRMQRAKLGAAVLQNEPADVQRHSEDLETLKQLEADFDALREKRKQTPKKIKIDENTPKEERPVQLRPLGKVLADAVKMIAYRAETALVGLLVPHLKKEDEARALVRELFVSSADFDPDEKANTLAVSIHRMACPAHDKAIAALLDELTQAQFVHPETGMRIVYRLA